MDNRILGEDNDEFKVNSLEDYRAAVHNMVTQAKHQIDVLTPDLEPTIFDTIKIEQAIFRLARLHPDTSIRILVKDSMRSVQNGHRVIRLAQQLTSSVFIHKPSNKHMEQQSSFIIVDHVGLIFRSVASERNYNATVNFKAPQPAARQQEYFDELWEHSSQDMQTRRLYV